MIKDSVLGCMPGFYIICTEYSVDISLSSSPMVLTVHTIRSIYSSLADSIGLTRTKRHEWHFVCVMQAMHLEV